MGLGALFILVALLLLILTANKKKNDLELRVNEVNQIWRFLNIGKKFIC